MCTLNVTLELLGWVFLKVVLRMLFIDIDIQSLAYQFLKTTG